MWKPQTSKSVFQNQSSLFASWWLTQVDWPRPLHFYLWFLTHSKTTYLERHGGIIILWNLPRQQHWSLHYCFDMKIFCKHCWKRKNSVFKPLLKTMTCPLPPWTTGLTLDVFYLDQREKWWFAYLFRLHTSFSQRSLLSVHFGQLYCVFLTWGHGDALSQTWLAFYNWNLRHPKHIKFHIRYLCTLAEPINMNGSISYL